MTLITRSFWDTLKNRDAHSASEEKVYGVAYRISRAFEAQVRDDLDIRERNGYSIHYTPFHPADGSTTIHTMVYIGTPENEQFIGPQDPQMLAARIYESSGPSGPNRDYLLGLEKSLDGLCPESRDLHVKDLANRLRRIQEEAQDYAVAPADAADLETRSDGTTHKQEETEH